MISRPAISSSTPPRQTPARPIARIKTKGTLYHYPNPHNHQILSIVGVPAPPRIAVQIATQATMTQMVARYWRGQPLEKVLARAEDELEGLRGPEQT